MERLLYTPQEAAELTSFTRDWLVRAASRGEIPHRRYGKRLFRFAHEDLEAIKDMGACPAEPGPAASGHGPAPGREPRRH